MCLQNVLPIYNIFKYTGTFAIILEGSGIKCRTNKANGVINYGHFRR